MAYRLLDFVKENLREKYYDPTFHGVQIDTRFRTAKETIGSAHSVGQMLGAIAQSLMWLEDSHTFVIPPAQNAHVDYGFRMKIIGEKAYVTYVKPQSDAETSGLKAGDIVLFLDSIEVNRKTLWKLEFLYNTLRLQPGVRLFVESVDGQTRHLDIKAQIWHDKTQLRFPEITTLINPDYLKQVERERNLLRDRFEVVDGVAIWRMGRFISVDQVDKAIKKVRKHPMLILDLRNNPGGYSYVLCYALGYFFGHDVKVADRKTRNDTKPLVAETKGKGYYDGKLVVLVNGESASSAEVFARVIQLEKRGDVIGDRTAGAVMQSQKYFGDFGGVSITIADLIMVDGKSLEKLGVTPDETVNPTGADLSYDRDVTLARALAILGVSVSPEKAGTLLSQDSTVIH